MEKSIVFHTPGSVHREAFGPIATEASERGYQVEFASTVSEEADIVFYNTHHSEIPAVHGKISIITFHGIDDAYKQSYYVDESWNRFDIGLLPGEQATTVWQSQSHHPKVHPSMGVYVTGWPKADRVASETFQAEVNKYKQQLDIKGKTVVYAPTIEYMDKLSDFLSSITDNIDTVLIKHGPYDDVKDYSAVEAYSGETDIHVLNKEMDTMVALALSDVLVSDQSSVLQEAILVDTIPVHPF